jgi:hypothetical protein
VALSWFIGGRIHDHLHPEEDDEAEEDDQS